ncbi:hypothetical protein [Brachybacterium sp. AOP24-D1-21]|uniref:hypothetical protein n=1 Tax=Brachybacterium sp. AOP24-D1-21 TaxID=3457711 RepID=UPI004033C185
MVRNATATQSDGSVRARITHGTQQVVGPLLIGVMGAHLDPVASEGSRVSQVRREVLTHRELGIPSPGVIGLDVGQRLRIEGVGELELVHLEGAAAHPATSQSGEGQRAVIFLELRPF